MLINMVDHESLSCFEIDLEKLLTYDGAFLMRKNVESFFIKNINFIPLYIKEKNPYVDNGTTVIIRLCKNVTVKKTIQTDREFIFGTKINEMRRYIPNFRYVFCQLDYQYPLTYSNLEMQYLTKDQKYKLIFFEDIDGTSIVEKKIDEKMMFNYVFQLAAALYMLHKMYGAVIDDLHPGNVIIRDLSRYITIKYKINGKDIIIKTNKIVTIIDFQYISLNTEGSFNHYINHIFFLLHKGSPKIIEEIIEKYMFSINSFETLFDFLLNDDRMSDIRVEKEEQIEEMKEIETTIQHYDLYEYNPNAGINSYTDVVSLFRNYIVTGDDKYKQYLKVICKSQKKDFTPLEKIKEIIKETIS